MSFGGIAQLVERLNGIQKVRGSTPLVSTITGVYAHFYKLCVFFYFVTLPNTTYFVKLVSVFFFYNEL